ncbi:acetyl-CoA hydrolase/transferase family protein [Rhodococcus opacus]|uniref:acetyl-CoA hydrolase/transferase family protein n=1 Tax=Rhodococcus opacus TaxID=37919 RepID=UPI001C43C1D2|nr:acetyl-CoA hydrolase/transferase C-terminal domain-containing protein [Rhodococcus opacus]MBV6759840.1 methyltransferase [Rhodococcus opacus]
MSTPIRVFADFSLADHLRAHDTVLVGQAAAEPHELVARLMEASQQIDGLTVVCGYALSDDWTRVTRDRPRVVTYSAHGPMRRLTRSGDIDILPNHYSHFERLVTTGPLRPDVILLQLPPADADGYHSFGTSVDYVAKAAQAAPFAVDARSGSGAGSGPVIIAEINENMPATRTKWRLHRSQITAFITTDRPLEGTPARTLSDIDHAIARNVASVVPDGAAVQLGIGALATAIGGALCGHRDLRVRSGLVGDWLLDLDAAGALASGEDTCVAGMALGSPELYAFVGQHERIRFVPITDLVAADAVASCDPYVAVNSALEVDLLGQINSEVIAGQYIGALGSQVDTFRATRIAKSGIAVVAMPARSPKSASQIVSALSGPVTSLQSDVDMVITEYGIADIQGTSASERAERLIGIAAPEHRDVLRAAVRF